MDIRDFAMEFFSLKGKNAIVTGGNTGLGQAFALALAKGGADVFVPSIVDDDGSTRELIEAEGVRYEFMQADITAPGAPAEIVAACVERFGAARHPHQQRGHLPACRGPRLRPAPVGRDGRRQSDGRLRDGP